MTVVSRHVPPMDAAEAPRREAIIRLAARASIEISAKQPEQIPAWGAVLPPGTEVFVAWVPGTLPGPIVTAALKLRAAGHEPVPHIAARQLTGAAAAEDLLARLRAEAGVTQVLMIAGDGAPARGPYGSSVALLETGLLAKHGFSRVNIAGYPEGHAVIPEAEVAIALRRKVALAADQGLQLRIVSQFCFDGAAVLGWLRRLRGEGIAAPVRVGVAGPASLRTLINFGLRCGIGNSLRALGNHTQSLAKLLTQQGPEQVVAALAPEHEALGVVGLHLFPFGGFPRSAQWLAGVREGRFTPMEDAFRMDS